MDLVVDIQHHGPPPPQARPARRVPWSPRAWGQLVALAAGVPVYLAPWLVPYLVLRWGEIHWRGQWDKAAWLLVFALSVLAMLVLVPALTRVQRHRLRSAGVEVLPQPRRPGWLTPHGIADAVQSQAAWRQTGYHLLAGPALAAAAATAIGLWVGGALFGTVYLYGWGISRDSLIRRGTYPDGVVNLVHLPGNVPLGVGLTAAGLAGLIAAPWLTSGVVRLDARLAQALLGPSRAKILEERVEELTQTRAGVVDAADAERRRLERDLHDGTQQRLVSLAINLGIARNQATSTEDARQAIAEAHEAAKAALAELRDLIRGLHPAVLEDRGLDAALSGVTARMPIPVRLTVDLPRRPAPVIEAVAYFVVSEGLANIVKHAGATEAAVFVQRAGDRLHVIVTDDGVGGADPARGTGLAGLARRAASVDGTFDIDSPPGGPTLLTVDLPCNR